MADGYCPNTVLEPTSNQPKASYSAIKMKTPGVSDGHQLLNHTPPPLYSPPPPSFLDVVQGKHLQSHANLHPYAKTSSESVQPHANLRSSALASGESAHSVLAREGLHHSRKAALKPVSSFKDKPCVAFSISEVKALEDNCKFALIGKFSHGRPSFTSIRTFLANLQLQGPFNLANLDKKHVLIECSCYADFYGLWLKLVCYIDGFAMRVFKWEPSYTPAKESAMAPVWIRIEGLPLHMFDEMPLRSIANSIGKPIKIDPQNINRTLVNCARICVELDVSKQLVDVIRLSLVDDVTGVEVEGRWLQVFYDVVPKYCVSCCHIGHGTVDCKRADPLPPVTTSRAQTYTQVWLPADRMKGAKLLQIGNLGCSSGAANAAQADQIGCGQKQDNADRMKGAKLMQSGNLGCSSGAANEDQAEQIGCGQKQDNKVEACSEQICNTPQHPQAKPFYSGQVKSSETADTQLQITYCLDQEEELQQTTVSADQAADSKQIAMAQNPTQEVPIEANLLDTSTVRKDTLLALTPVMVENIQGSKEWKPKENQGECMRIVASKGPSKGLMIEEAASAKVAPLITATAVENYSNETRLQQDPSASGWVQKDGKNECTTLVAWTAAAETEQATPPKLSWADQVELEQDQVTPNSRRKNHYMPLEHTFEQHNKKEEGVFGNFLCASIPEFYYLLQQEQKDEAAYIMAEFYQYFVRIALEEEIERDSKTAAPEPEHLPTEQEWQTVTSKKKRTTKVKDDQKGYQSRQMVDTRIESLRARINKMKRDCPAKRKLLAELEDLNQLHFEDGA